MLLAICLLFSLEKMEVHITIVFRHRRSPTSPRPRAPQTATWQVPWVSSVRELPFAFSARHGVNARKPAEARDGGTPTADCHVRSPRRSRGGRSAAALHLLRGGLGVGDGATRPRGRGTQTQPSRGLQGLRKLRAPGPAARAATPSTDRPSAPPPPSPPLSRPKARRFPDSARPSAHHSRKWKELLNDLYINPVCQISWESVSVSLLSCV